MIDILFDWENINIPYMHELRPCMRSGSYLASKMEGEAVINYHKRIKDDIEYCLTGLDEIKTRIFLRLLQDEITYHNDLSTFIIRWNI